MPRFSCAICFNRDNTISYANRVLQIERTRWRGTLPGCRVLVCEHLDSSLTVYFGPIRGALPAPNKRGKLRRAVEKTS